jgi:hypothetical protein
MIDAPYMSELRNPAFVEHYKQRRLRSLKRGTLLRTRHNLFHVNKEPAELCSWLRRLGVRVHPTHHGLWICIDHFQNADDVLYRFRFLANLPKREPRSARGTAVPMRGKHVELVRASSDRFKQIGSRLESSEPDDDRAEPTCA